MASDPTLKLKVEAGNTSQVITKLQKDVEKLGNRLAAASKKGRKGARSMRVDLKKLIPAITGVAGGYTLIGSAISTVLAKNKEFSRDVDRIANKFSELELKLQIQAGLTPGQLQKKLPTILKGLLQTPSTDVAGALQIETQLASSGFKQVDRDSGAALQTILKLKAATNQFGRAMEDPKEAVKSISQFIKGSQGVSQPSAANILKTGGGLTQLFEGSEIQFKDLSALAANSAQLKSLGMTPETQLSAFSVLRDVKEAPEASTGLRQVTSRLRGASQSGKKVQALGRIGLKPEDVDLIGEDLPTALGRLKKGLASVGDKQASDTTQILFGEKGAAASSILLDQVDLIKKREQLLKGGAFQRNVALFQGSTFARRQRLGVREEFAKRVGSLKQDDVTFDFLRAAGRARQAELLLDAKTPEERTKISIQAALAEAHFSIRELFGLTAEGSGPIQQIKGSGKSINEAMTAAAERSAEIAERQLEVMQKIEKKILDAPLRRNANR